MMMPGVIAANSAWQCRGFKFAGRTGAVTVLRLAGLGLRRASRTVTVTFRVHTLLSLSPGPSHLGGLPLMPPRRPPLSLPVSLAVAAPGPGVPPAHRNGVARSVSH